MDTHFFVHFSPWVPYLNVTVDQENGIFLYRVETVNYKRPFPSTGYEKKNETVTLWDVCLFSLHFGPL